MLETCLGHGRSPVAKRTTEVQALNYSMRSAGTGETETLGWRIGKERPHKKYIQALKKLRNRQFHATPDTSQQILLSKLTSKSQQHTAKNVLEAASLLRAKKSNADNALTSILVLPDPPQSRRAEQAMEDAEAALRLQEQAADATGSLPVEERRVATMTNEPIQKSLSRAPS